MFKDTRLLTAQLQRAPESRDLASTVNSFQELLRDKPSTAEVRTFPGPKIRTWGTRPTQRFVLPHPSRAWMGHPPA